ncbi:MAG TPA: hypothetical protein VFS43_28070 [Polyangiaceae bacterium]|nr:hypothetical protein [Polyangiaceae bacterium]
MTFRTCLSACLAAFSLSLATPACQGPPPARLGAEAGLALRGPQPRSDGSGNGACWVDGQKAPTDLSLFVTGLNHSRNHAHDQPVDQAGVSELVDFIVDVTPDPDGLVVALTGNLIRDCTVGPSFQHPSGVVHNGECVASLLQQRLGRPFAIQQFDIWEGRGGNAVITGPRWKPIGVDPVRTAAGVTFLGVRLHDERKARTAPGSSFYIYVAHTSVNDAALPEVSAMVDAAWRKAKLQPDDLPPIMVGDFNAPECGGGRECPPPAWAVAPALEAFLRDNVRWADRQVSCPAQNGLGPVELRLENDLIHVLLGKHGGPLSFGCSPGRFEPVRVSYVTDGGGNPLYPREGINLPIIRHNVVGLNFKIVSESPPACAAGTTCEAGACVTDCPCSKRKAAGEACGQADACGNACSCAEGLQCQGGRCSPRAPGCEDRCANTLALCAGSCAPSDRACPDRCRRANAACLAACAPPAGPGLGFYKQADRPAVYLAYSPTSYCRVASDDQMHAFGGYGKVTTVARLNFAGRTQTGTCGWPNGFYKRQGEREVYRMYGGGLPEFNVGESYCHVANDAQMNIFGGYGQVREVPRDSDLGRGRTFTGACRNP